MTRPKIWKDTTRKVLPWCATNPYKPGTHRLFATWEESLYYVATALRHPFPMELDRKGEESIMTAHRSEGVIICDLENVLILEPHHWRPLARALTRLADLEGVK